MEKNNMKLCMLKGRLEMLSMGEGRRVGTHTTLQLNLKIKSYPIVMQLSLGYYNYYVIISLEI
jgi:hypothetical protein